MDDVIAKTDKTEIAKVDQVDSVSHMLYLVSTWHTAMTHIFPPELILAICWEESRWQNIPQFGGGPAVGYGQLEKGGRYKANQFECGNYSVFSEGRFTGAAILGSAEISIQAVGYCLAGLYNHPQLSHTRDGALDAYAGVLHRPENKPIPGRWVKSSDALRACLSVPWMMSQLAFEDALRQSRTFPTSGGIYDCIHERLWPLMDILNAIQSALAINSQGMQVSYLQDTLNRLPSNDPWSSSASLPLKADGIFGSKTATRVRQFQSRNGLDPDGVVGTLTRAKLVAQVASFS